MTLQYTIKTIYKTIIFLHSKPHFIFILYQTSMLHNINVFLSHCDFTIEYVHYNMCDAKISIFKLLYIHYEQSMKHVLVKCLMIMNQSNSWSSNVKLITYYLGQVSRFKQVSTQCLHTYLPNYYLDYIVKLNGQVV